MIIRVMLLFLLLSPSKALILSPKCPICLLNLMCIQNPFHESVTIDSKSVRIFDVLGRRMYDGSGGLIDTSDFPTGLYVVQSGLDSRVVIKR